jgi:histidyl-tRNA synthetase
VKFKSIRGTHDILPDESLRWQFVEQAIRKVMHRFNYREIRTPIFEETSLFARSIGELTDIVGKEMYTFEDRSGTSLTLKPEMTASVARAYIQHHLGEQLPLTKLYYISPMFRQERPQAGRLRQFHQFGAEAIGGPQATIDAEIIAVAVEVYRTLGVNDFALRVNSVGCPNCRPAYRERLQQFLTGVVDQLSDESMRRVEQNPLRVLDSKDEADQRATANAPLMINHLCDECKQHFGELQTALRLLHIAFTIDGRIVRGLDYYTRTAFEITSTALGSQDALAGGGRYDGLIEELGGKHTPAVGFAAGVERLLMVLKTTEADGGTDGLRPKLFVAAADDAGRNWTLSTIMELRHAGISCEWDLLGRSLKAQMREADRQRAEFVLVVGSREIDQNEGKLKEMSSGIDRTIHLTDLATTLAETNNRT